MPVPLSQFIQALAAAELMSADDAQAFINALPAAERPDDGDTLARRLVKAGKLTAFQAQHVAAGRAAALTVGEYLLVDRIGAGGMGQVFKAQHRRMQRVVALKMMSPQAMKDEAAVKRFEREVRAAARLEHQNIVTAYDAGRHGKTHFLVMQYVEGGDLAALVKAKGPLPVDRAVSFTIQAARGLAFAHGEGIVHRDIKPANLLIDKKGTVKILDMGLARVVEGNDELTGTEQVMGTVDYMSPEQASEAKNADARSDIYSLGCTLWFLLTGTRLYDGDSMIARLVKHRDALLPSLLQARDDAPWSLEQALHKMIAKRADDRYQSMDEVIVALDEVHASVGAGGMGSAVLGGDADLQQFLSGIGGGGASRIGGASRVGAGSSNVLGPGSSGILQTGGDSGSRPGSKSGSKSGSRSGLTVPLSAATGDTSGITTPAGPRSAVGRGGRATAAAPTKRAGNRKLLFAAGAAAVLLIVGGLIWGLSGSRDDAAVPPSTLVGAGPGPKGKPAVPLKAPFDAATARAAQQAWAAKLGIPVVSQNSIGMKFVLIPPGEYLMGSSAAQMAQVMKDVAATNVINVEEDLQSETPQHRVVISKPFLLGETEVTVAQFAKFVEATRYETYFELTHPNDPKNWRRPESSDAEPNSPVVCVEVQDAAAFCNWLSAQEKLPPAYTQSPTIGWIPLANPRGYRLPTEAQWEYACRAGTTTAWHFGDDAAQLMEYAWMQQNSGGRLQPVGKLKPNPFGLFDMHGNVYEWCLDSYAADWYGRSPAVDPENIGGGPGGLYRSSHAHQQHAPFSRAAFRRNAISPQWNHSGWRLSRIIDTAGAGGVTTSAPGAAAQTVAAAGGAKPAISFGLPGAAPTGKPADFAAERRAAEWALGKGGIVRAANAGGSVVEFKDRPSPPPGDWRVVSISVRDRRNVRDDELRILEPLSDLQMLDLARSGITNRALPLVGKLKTLVDLDLSDSGANDRDVEHLVELRKLERLALYGTQVSEDGLAKLTLAPLKHLELGSITAGNALIGLLRSFPQIESVRLAQVFISDSSLPGLAQLTNLKTLELRDARVTDAGLKTLATLSNLEELALGGLGVTPIGLEHLKSLRGLKRLTLNNMKVLAAAAVELQQAMPNTDVLMDGARVAAKPFPSPPEPAPAVPHNTLTETERAAGWRVLFDGATLNGWRRTDGDGTPIGWWAVDGQIRTDGNAAFIMTTDDFEFYDFRFDFRATPDGNSGVCYHVDAALSPPTRSAPEFELKAADSSTGLIWNVGDLSKGVALSANPDAWYGCRLVTAPRRARHFVYDAQGKLLLDKKYDLDSPEYQKSPLRNNPDFLRQERGRLALQSMTGSIAYRNLKLLPLTPDAASKLATE